MAWYKNSKGHSLASRGMKSAQKLPKTVNIDLKRYQGKWYEIQKLPNSFQKGCKKAIAEYELKKNFVQVKNSCIKDGQRQFRYAKAYPKGKGKLEVDFVGGRIFTGDYWVLHIDKDYDNAIVGTPDRKLLWILSRNKQVPAKKLTLLRSIAKSKGFDTTNLR